MGAHMPTSLTLKNIPDAVYERLKAAAELGLKVLRVPAYSPYAVAEHTVALILTLNRKTHRAYNRVREHNFSLGGLVGFDLHARTVGVVGNNPKFAAGTFSSAVVTQIHTHIHTHTHTHIHFK